MSDTTITPNIPATIENAPNFGNGRYGDFQRSLYADSQALLGMSKQAAEKFAKAAATDFGLAMAQAKIEGKVSKPTGKDMKVTLSEAAKMKGVHSTLPLSLVHALQWMGEAGKHGVSYGKTSWVLTPELSAYVDDLE